MDESQTHYAKWKKLDKDYTLHYSIHIKSCNVQTNLSQKADDWLPGKRDEGRDELQKETTNLLGKMEITSLVMASWTCAFILKNPFMHSKYMQLIVL